MKEYKILKTKKHNFLIKKNRVCACNFLAEWSLRGTERWRKKNKCRLKNKTNQDTVFLYNCRFFFFRFFFSIFFYLYSRQVDALFVKRDSGLVGRWYIYIYIVYMCVTSMGTKCYARDPPMCVRMRKCVSTYVWFHVLKMKRQSGLRFQQNETKEKSVLTKWLIRWRTKIWNATVVINFILLIYLLTRKAY